MKIFLSYSWSETEQADSIENFFSSIGISVIRDINDLKYRQNIKSFMTLIRDCDFAIVLISIEYLKSPNCLYELIEFQKEKEFLKKFLPITIDGTQIYSTESKLKIIKFWQNKVQSIKRLYKSYEPTKTISIIQEIKHYEFIYSEIDSLISTIADYKNITFSDGNKNKFKDIIEFIGLEYPEIKIEISKIQTIKNPEIQDIKIEELKRKYPGNLNILFAEGFINLTQRKNYLKAKNKFEDYIKITRDSEGLNNLGLCLYNLGAIEEAEIIYKESLLLNQTYQIYSNFGLLESKKGRYDKAIEYWKKSIEINPNNSECLFNIGKLYTDMKADFENGMIFYLRAIDANPNLVEAYNNIASIFIRQGKFEDASLYLELSIKLNPNDYVSMYNLGAIYANISGKHILAKSLYRQSIRENPIYISPKVGLAKLLILTRGDLEEAKDLFRDILKIDSENSEIKQLLDYFENKKNYC